MFKQTVIAIGMMTLTGAAFAGHTHGDMQSDVDATENSPFAVTFDTLDADNNGKVTWPEAKNHFEAKKGFKSVDADGNGKLSKAEFKEPEVIPSQ